MSELALALLLCNLLSGGETEQRHYFANVGQSVHVRIDCETPTHVIEIGLDGKPDSRDSVHQALFAGFLTKKQPMVIVIDQDGIEDRHQYEIRVVSALANVPYGTCRGGFLKTWADSARFRSLHKTRYLPPIDVTRRFCDFGGQFGKESRDMVPVLSLDKQDFFDDESIPAAQYE